MHKKWFIAKTLLLTAVLLASLTLAQHLVSAESPKLIHVEGTYTPAYPLPTASPTPGPTATPTTTPINSPTQPETSTNTQTPSVAPTETTPTGTHTSTADPTLTPNPTSNPTATDNPEIPELTPVALIATLVLLAAVAVFSRKSRPTLKRTGSIAVLIAVLALSLMTNVSYGQTTTPTATHTPVVGYSLWFTNGTAVPTDGANCYGVLYGGPFLNVGGIKPIASGFGSSADKTSSIIVLRNDGDTPINVSLALKNAQVPSDIEISLHYFFMNNHTYRPYTAQCMGNSNVAQNPLEPGQHMWLAITVSLAQPSVPLTGTPNYSFNYSYDIEVTATQA